MTRKEVFKKAKKIVDQLPADTIWQLDVLRVELDPDDLDDFAWFYERATMKLADI